MLRMLRVTVVAAVAAITLSPAVAHAQSTAMPSLAEVARQTAAKWATGKRATKVYTNASLATVPEDVAPSTVTVAAAAPATAASTPASQATAAAAVPGKDQATKAVAAEDENAWREESAKNRRDLDQARAALDALRNAPAPTTERQRRDAERQLQQAQRTFEYFEKRWNAHVKAAEAAKVPPSWLEPKQ